MNEDVYPFCDIRFKNISLILLPRTCRQVKIHVAELYSIWGDVSVYLRNRTDKLIVKTLNVVV